MPTGYGYVPRWDFEILFLFTCFLYASCSIRLGDIIIKSVLTRVPVRSGEATATGRTKRFRSPAETDYLEKKKPLLRFTQSVCTLKYNVQASTLPEPYGRRTRIVIVHYLLRSWVRVRYCTLYYYTVCGVRQNFTRVTRGASRQQQVSRESTGLLKPP